MALERLQKILAFYGLGSRRRCEEIVASGRVSVNGHVSALGDKADPDVDTIRVDGQVIAANTVQELVYLLLNKPAGYVTTVKDEGGRATVMEFVKNIPQRVFPVGRLDRDTEGLLLFTNDGDFAYLLTHPSHSVEKEYLAKVRYLPDRNGLDMLCRGVMLEDGLTAPAKAWISGPDTVSLIIHEGRKRQVRRMLGAVGSPVVALRRVRVGNLQLGALPLGHSRRLTAAEVTALRRGAQHS